ncbi:hypothetical protein ACLGL1_07080 [Peptococcus simiae]|uniref:hypothetical protein n=1 Tax=Peptococcus simiae TaxID=1643805 RepID=UPI0039809CBA
MKRKLVTITLSASLVMTALAIPAYTEAFAASPKTESIEARASGNFQRLAKLSQKPQLNEEEVQFVISLNAVYGSLPAKEKPLVTQIMRRMPQMQVANYHKALEKKTVRRQLMNNDSYSSLMSCGPRMG